ncbi:transcription termination factor NusA [Candidatus Curtissbacteria bacterium RIFCSPLOWO2_01_FULL_38_11b]|uniref:Transcription termination/antitermination protein NusA n=1 Tax=Candidatus Curtissbacteria bacterium RIFCSPLOWO2_01_FULL_38_11b TaxID=1797725 RepID=A0A1F5GZ22_9BACT|nr:MAG: transcription termination factor NusA [Candidatus Curtissbacteria bacterium RIFCSPLOWO2_01_FULL_38_11b]
MAIQARTEFASALNQVCSERGLEPEVVLDSIKQAILAAYRKDYGDPEGIIVDLNAETGEVALSKNKKIITPPGFGRIAAQTAKQVILQRIREAEKNAILSEYSSKIGTIVSGIIQRISGPIVTVNLGKAEGIMPPPEQSQEKYFVNQRLKFYVVGIKEGTHGEEIIVSRSASGLLEGLFKQEVPEVASGAVEIKAVAREAGSRSKIAVFSDQLGVDPVGSCVGQKGVRVQAVINELGDEKIDVIAYQEDKVEFIKSALSPAKDLQVKVNEKDNNAQVIAPDDQLSLAIGREGQNVRLAARLTGYKIDIRGKGGTPKEVEAKEKKAQEEAKKALGVTDKETKVAKEPAAKGEPRSNEPEEPKEKVSQASKVAKEKGTVEKSSSTDDTSSQPSDQPVDDSQALSDDQNQKNTEEKKTNSVKSVVASEPSKSDDGDKAS